MACTNLRCESPLTSDQILQVDISLDNIAINSGISNIGLFLTDDAGLVDSSDPASGGYLTTDNRVKRVGSIEDITKHWDTNSETYEKLVKGLQATKSIGVLKVGYVDPAETMLDGVIEIQKCDTNWFALNHLYTRTSGTDWGDGLEVQPVAEYLMALGKMIFTDSRDVESLQSNDVTSIKYKLYASDIAFAVVDFQKSYCKTEIIGGVEVSDDAWNDTGIITMQQRASINHDISDSAKTTKFSNDYPSTRSSNYTIDEITNLTSYSKGTGLISGGNGSANTYANVASFGSIYMEGLTVTGQWIDRIHQNIFVKYRIIDRIANAMKQKLPYTEEGASIVDNAINRVAIQMQTSGIISTDPLDAEDNDGKSYSIVRNSVNLATDEQRSNRILPPYTFCYLPAGAIHSGAVSISNC